VLYLARSIAVTVTVNVPRNTASELRRERSGARAILALTLISAVPQEAPHRPGP
jgi:hypothetical protein